MKLVEGVNMEICFLNKCSVNIFISVNDKEAFVLEPYEKKVISLDKDHENTLTVRKKDESFLEKTAFKKVYKLTVETAYALSITGNDSVMLVFVRECVRVIGNAYYEKIILKDKHDYCIEKHNAICGLNHIRKVYKRRQLAYWLLVSPFEHMTLLCLAIIILAIVFACKISVLFSLLFF